VEAGGATIISDIDRQGFVDAAQPVYAKFAADPKLQELIKQIQATE
jgi:TRAP-type C4-dicarboxylate transport system substrate-binding protein